MNLTANLLDFAIRMIENIGYLGIIIILIADNCGVPIPSEAILALGGAAAATGKFNIFVVMIIGTLAQTLGAYIAYQIGLHGGEPLVKRYGKYLLISSHDYDKAKAWFQKRGGQAIFISRLTPVIRTFISFPAGTFRMDLRRFLRDTFLGSLVWTIIFVTLGYLLGDNWRRYYDYLHYVDYLVIIAVLVLGGRFVYRKLKKKAEEK